MTTLNNTNQPNNSSGIWFFLGMVLLVAAIFAVIFYGVPAIRSSIGSPQINVPDKININVNQTK